MELKAERRARLKAGEFQAYRSISHFGIVALALASYSAS